MMPDTGFPYIAEPDARVLILGSMPGRKSLAQQQYYAHAQNSFWPIMGALFGFSDELFYEQRLAALRKHRIALWDVAYQCERPGSLDQAIAMDTVVANDFTAFFTQHRKIHTIFFNGRKAEQLYHRLVVRAQTVNIQPIPMFLLPSSSPAHASMTRQQKLEHWHLMKHTLEST